MSGVTPPRPLHVVTVCLYLSFGRQSGQQRQFTAGLQAGSSQQCKTALFWVVSHRVVASMWQLEVRLCCNVSKDYHCRYVTARKSAVIKHTAPESSRGMGVALRSRSTRIVRRMCQRGTELAG